jgi:hypothetical protein
MLTDSTSFQALLKEGPSFLNSSVLEIIIINLAINIFAIIYFWYQTKIKISAQNKIELELKKRDAFKNLLKLHTDILLGRPLSEENANKWDLKYSEMSVNILLWGSDKVIYEYSKYILAKNANNDKFEEREINFANAVLAFRKEIGYKNRFGRIKPEYVIKIFKANLFSGNHTI